LLLNARRAENMIDRSTALSSKCGQ